MSNYRKVTRLAAKFCLALSTAATLTLGLAGPAVAAGGAAGQETGEILLADSEHAIEGKYIVALEGGTSLRPAAEAAVRAQARDLLEEYGGRLGHTYSAVLRGFSVTMSESAARQLAADPAVRYVEQQIMVYAAGTQEDPPSYGLDRIDARDGLDDSYTYPNGGSGVTVYDTDTGLNIDHESFEGRAVSGYDALEEDGTVNECENQGTGHGTHTAGTIGSEKFGVAKDVRLVGVRVLGCDGTAPDAESVEGLDWIVQHLQLPAVVNMSWEYFEGSQANEEAVQNVIDAGAVAVAAAGNSSTDACSASPARIPDVVTVAATTRNDSRASYSNYGSCVDLFAPGSGIVSAGNRSDTGSSTMSGTSMAAPHVSGAAALYLSTHQQASPDEVRDALVNSASKGKISDAGPESPNLLLYVGTAENPDPEPDPEPDPNPDKPQASFTVQCQFQSGCTFDASASTDDGGITGYAWNFGDGTTGNGETTQHTYTGGGSYTATLTVTDEAGQTDTAQRSLRCYDFGTSAFCFPM